MKHNNWYLKGCPELRNFFNENNITHLAGGDPTGYYFITEKARWDYTDVAKPRKRKLVSFDEFLAIYNNTETSYELW